MAFCLTPAWDEWIEIRKSCISTASDRCLTPHGVSGLKYGNGSEVDCLFKSHPAWGEWIEILYLSLYSQYKSSHPAWGEWIEIQQDMKRRNESPGLTLVWGEWIEISDSK